jgi:hypothetical protein
MSIESLRREYHREICQRILYVGTGDIPNIADKYSHPSVALAQGIVKRLKYPQRIASIALGTGDIDCVYHMALPELVDAAREYNNPAVTDMLDTLIAGKRLRDISDLPFDLAA